jgi:endonuclease YncB( thermonuclease family)
MARRSWNADGTQGNGALSAPAFALLAALTWAGLHAPAAYAASIEPNRVRVLDGDTIRLNGKKPDVQLVGFNAPEARGATCKEELELGGRATRRLRDLVKAGNLDFEYVPCACPRGTTEGTKACNYGRRCGTLKANGRDVGAILIAEKLAVPFQCGQTGCPPLPRPWCE